MKSRAGSAREYYDDLSLNATQLLVKILNRFYEMNPRTLFIQEMETGRYVLYAFKTSEIYYKSCSLQTDHSSIEAQAK